MEWFQRILRRNNLIAERHFWKPGKLVQNTHSLFDILRYLECLYLQINCRDGYRIFAKNYTHKANNRMDPLLKLQQQHTTINNLLGRTLEPLLFFGGLSVRRRGAL